MYRTLAVGVVLAGVFAGHADAQIKPVPGADRAAAAGSTALRSGDFLTAIGQWELATRLYSEAGQSSAQVRALLQLAEAHQSLGDYARARATLLLSRTLVEGTRDQRLRAQVLGALGNILSTLSRAEADR
jgi:tetratricopeptide (TPR) repeat protein